MLSITGLPYDTLHEVIGIRENASSLKSYNVNYDQIDLVNNDFDYERIQKRLQESKVKLIEIQRSKGYSTRKSITIEQLEKVIKAIREVDKEVIIMVDNCYCEFVTKVEPIEIGADIAVGSLIKNLGGGIAPNGAYIVGRKDLIALAILIYLFLMLVLLLFLLLVRLAFLLQVLLGLFFLLCMHHSVLNLHLNF